MHIYSYKQYLRLFKLWSNSFPCVVYTTLSHTGSKCCYRPCVIRLVHHVVPSHRTKEGNGASRVETDPRENGSPRRRWVNIWQHSNDVVSCSQFLVLHSSTSNGSHWEHIPSGWRTWRYKVLDLCQPPLCCDYMPNICYKTWNPCWRYLFLCPYPRSIFLSSGHLVAFKAIPTHSKQTSYLWYWR